MKIFVTGISGLLGLNMALQLCERYEVSGCYRSHPLAAPRIRAFRCDLAESSDIEQLLDDIRPDAVVNVAGLANVDQCERDPDLAYRVNVTAAERVAAAAARTGALLLHISTDHLFDGTRPLRTETERASPLNVYAQTKWAAEQKVAAAHHGALIVRTNFFGWGSPLRESLSDWVLHGLRQSQERSMFTDVFFSPLLVNDLIDRSIALMLNRVSGVVHLGGADRLSKYDFGVRLARVFGYPTSAILPVSVASRKLDAARPMDMSLNSTKAEQLLGARMPSVDDALARLRDLEAEGWPQDLQKALAA